MSQITLQKLINEGASLNDKQKQSLYNLLCKRAHEKTKNRLHSIIWWHSLSQWPNYGIFNRVHLEGDEFTYCAGQHYPSEVAYVRNLIIGKAS